MNQYEGFCLIKKFAHIDDLIIVNTCCVTKEAELKSFRKYQRAAKKYPKSKIIATGCACRFNPERFAGAYQVLDNMQRIDMIKDILPIPDKSRYFLKIEDGCNEDCSFCLVSKVRNKIESKSIADIEKEINWAMSLRFKEIVLVGANIGLYGFDFGLRLTDLLKALKKIPELPRIRLSSIEPRFMNQELIQGLKGIPFCHHFHIPIQSANDDVLSQMGRAYDVSYLKEMVNLIRGNFDDVAIGADIIVGFPGEGEKEFLNTYDFIKFSPFTNLHIFPYSQRPLTRAYDRGDPVLPATKKERLWRLKDLIAEKNYRFRQSLVDKTFNCIIENDKTNSSIGLTDNYVRVKIKDCLPKNDLVKVRITKVDRDYTCGSVITMTNKIPEI